MDNKKKINRISSESDNFVDDGEYYSNNYSKRQSFNVLTLKENSSLPKKVIHSSKSILKKNKDIAPADSGSSEENIQDKQSKQLVEDQKFEVDITVNSKKSLRQILDRILSTNKRKIVIQSIICIISLFSFILYIITTYESTMQPYLDFIDCGVCIVYFLEFILNCCLAHHRINFLFSVQTLIDTFTMLPILSLINPGRFLSDVICISRVLRLIRFFRLFSLFKSGENDVNKQIMMIINTLIMMVLLSAGIIHILEKEAVDEKLSLAYNDFVRDQLKMRKLFHHYIYFILVTISTVGYGDIVPYTIYGRIVIMTLVLFTLILIPKQTNDLIQLMDAQSFYARRKYKASQDIFHIILTGDITIDSLKSFCQEYFHQDHGTKYRHAVIINSQNPSGDMEKFLNDKENENKLFYLEGDPMSEKDLLRADIAKAKACVIFNNKNSHDPHSSDHQNLLLGLYIKKFVYTICEETNSPTSFRLCIQLIKPESKYHYFNALQDKYKKSMAPDQLIIIEEIKMNLLAKSCITPGILALLSNLVMSANSLPTDHNDDWLKEYSEGRGHEIYRIQLSESYKGMSFLDFVKEIYSHDQAIAFALEIEIDRLSVLKLNPGNVIIGSIVSGEKYSTFTVKYFAYIICSEKSVADNIGNKDKDKKQALNLTIVYNINKKTKSSFSGYSDDSSDNSNSENEDVRLGPRIMEDFEINPDDFFIHKNQNEFLIDNNVDIMQHTIKDSKIIKNHIIICGIHPSLIHFILPLRAKYLGEDNLKYIVILTPHLPQNLYDSFTRFPKMIFIQGSPLLPENLYRANINNADKAVILSTNEGRVGKMSNDVMYNNEDQMLDAESIFIFKAIKKCNKKIQIITELIATNNVEYLLHKNYLKSIITKRDFLPLYEFTPLFAAGEVMTPSIIDRITCQSYYNPHIITILEQIISGGITNKNKKVKKLEDDIHLQGSNLWLVRVPEALIGDSFESLFNHLIKSNYVVAIALYRKNIEDEMYYVYTNPKKTTMIHKNDLVFVLGLNNNIIDLIEDRTEKKKTVAKEYIDSSDSYDDKSFDLKENQNDNRKTFFKSREEINLHPTLAMEFMKKHQRTNSDGRKKTFKQENKKENTSSKYIDIERIKNRLHKIKDDLTRLKDEYNDLPKLLEDVINREVENELKIYLNKNDN